jgi:hypothetical protein
VLRKVLSVITNVAVFMVSIVEPLHVSDTVYTCVALFAGSSVVVIIVHVDAYVAFEFMALVLIWDSEYLHIVTSIAFVVEVVDVGLGYLHVFGFPLESSVESRLSLR